MLKKLKTFCKYILFTIIALTVWVLINSIDEPTYNDLGVLGKLKKIPKSENGYEIIKYLDESDRDIFRDDELFKKLDFHVKGNEWSQVFVDKTLIEYSQIISDVEASTHQPYFKFPDNESIADIPAYMGIINASRLLVVKSKSEAKAGELDAAIQTLQTAFKFGQNIKAEENATLLSYMIGVAMHDMQTGWLHQFLQNDNLSLKQIDHLQNAMKSISSFQEDGFKKVFYGEYKFAEIFTEEIKRQSLQERLDQYWSWDIIWDENNEGFSSEFYLINFLQALIPNYYFHPNEFLTYAAQVYIDLSDQTLKYFKNIIFPKSDYEPSWIDFIKPNSMMEGALGNVFDIYKTYFIRRYLNHVHYDSLRAFIAMRKYQIVNGEFPSNLGQLVPEYLDELPIDYFNGETLKYSRENGWLYSVGVNLEDNGGSVESMLGNSSKYDFCKDNPTITISPVFTVEN